MRITLQIENVDRLETGGQLSYSCADRGFDIGRHEHLDWSLPDPQRVISGKHCEVRFESGNFVLYDYSTNGTFLNGSQTRMDKAHVLRSGDRLMIGDYIIVVSLEAGSGQPARSAAPVAAAAPQPWTHLKPRLCLVVALLGLRTRTGGRGSWSLPNGKSGWALGYTGSGHGRATRSAFLQSRHRHAGR